MNANTLPVPEKLVEPLTPASARQLRRIVVNPYDFLAIGVDDNFTHFSIEAFRHNGTSPSSTDNTGFWTPTGRVYRASSHPSRTVFDFIERIPEITRNKKLDRYEWRAGATDFTATMVMQCWPQQNILWLSPAARQMMEMLALRFASQTHRATLAAEYKLNAVVPPLPASFVEHPSLPLSDYQRAAVAYALASDSTALFMDRGTGKTATAINAICTTARETHNTGRMHRALVVCPNQVRSNWANEIRRFCTLPGKTTVIRGGGIDRVRLLTLAIASDGKSAFSIVIIGYDTAAVMGDILAKIPWDDVVLDESHYIKSALTQRWKALIKLREVSKRRMILTGTPIGNSPMDLWAQLEFLGHGLSGFTSFKAFRTYHGVWEKAESEFGVDRLVSIKNVPMLQERLARLSFAVTKQEAGLKLPDKVYSTVEAEMTEVQADWYRKIADELVLEIESRLEGGQPDTVTAENILTSLLRLAQVTSGFIITDAIVDSTTGEVVKPRTLKRLPGDNPKIYALVDLLLDEDRDPRGKTVVWCTFVEDIRHISEALTEKGVVHGTYYGATNERDREECVRRFNNDPTFKVMVCNPQTAGEGLNLLGFNPERPDECNTFCDMEVFFSQNWSAIQRSQAEDRAHRRGTRMPVQIIDLAIPGTVDEEIRERVRSKQAMANLTLDIKDILANVLNIKF